MLQENSARKEDLPSTAAPFFDSSSTTVVSGDLGTFSRAIVVEAPGYVLGRAVHSAFSFAAHFAAVIAIVWFWPLTFPQKPFLFAMSQQFVTVPFAPPARSPRAKFSFSSRSFADPLIAEAGWAGQEICQAQAYSGGTRRNPPLVAAAGHRGMGCRPRRYCERRVATRGRVCAAA